MRIKNVTFRRVNFLRIVVVMVNVIVLVVIVAGIISLKFTPQPKSKLNTDIISGSFDLAKFKTDQEWREILTSREYHILREKGTEMPFIGELLHNDKKGTYASVGCDEPVFRSEQKFDSGTGWPSFTAPIREDAVVLRKDSSFGVERIEVLDRCGGHLGHLFNDGPPPTGKRYCMNSIALRFIPDEK